MKRLQLLAGLFSLMIFIWVTLFGSWKTGLLAAAGGYVIAQLVIHPVSSFAKPPKR